jgi:hypothetical protein
MGWGIDFSANIFISKVSANDITDVEQLIKESKETIDRCKNKIQMYMSSNVKDVTPEDWKDEPVSWLIIEFNDTYETLEQELFTLFKLELYLEHLKKKQK